MVEQTGLWEIVELIQKQIINRRNLSQFYNDSSDSKSSAVVHHFCLTFSHFQPNLWRAAAGFLLWSRSHSNWTTATPWGQTWPLTPDPEPPPPPMVRSTRGLDGTCVEGGRQPRPLPPTAGVQYLLVCRWRASAWPAPAWWGFHLGGGSPTNDHVCLQSEKEERERTGSMQTDTRLRPICTQALWFVLSLFECQTGGDSQSEGNSEWGGVERSENFSFLLSALTFPLMKVSDL